MATNYLLAGMIFQGGVGWGGGHHIGGGWGGGVGTRSPGSYMDVAKNRGTPKWMVYFMENPIKIDDLGVPLFLETPI